jgi:glycosyltransferase involved in cell wall biosynthesis
MKILVVSSYLPYPLYSGGAVRLFNLLKHLSRNHEITLVCEKRFHQSQDDVKQVEKVCKNVYVTARKNQWSYSNIIKTGFSDKPFLLTGHTTREMKKIIVELLSESSYDLIHVETFYVMQNIPKTYIPIVLVEHNIEYLVYERYMKTASLYAKPFLFIDIQKMKKWESYFWKVATKLVAVSDVEKKKMDREDVIVVPNGVDIHKFKVQNLDVRFKRKEKRILFIGDFKWIQNQKTVEEIVQRIWPIKLSQIELKHMLIKLWIVGKNIPQHLLQCSSDTIIFDQNAPKETEKIYHKSHILLAPIFVGGGTSYKILEAMGSGVPVVTTPLGIEGIGARQERMS